MDPTPSFPAGLIRANQNLGVTKIMPADASRPKDHSQDLGWLNQVTVSNFITNAICGACDSYSAREILQYPADNYFLGLPAAIAKCKSVPKSLKEAAKELVTQASKLISEETQFIDELIATRKKAIKFANATNSSEIVSNAGALPGATIASLWSVLLGAELKSLFGKSNQASNSQTALFNDTSRLLPEALTKAIESFYSQLTECYDFDEPEFFYEGMPTKYLHIDGSNPKSIERMIGQEIRDPRTFTHKLDLALVQMETNCDKNPSLSESIDKRFKWVVWREQYLQHIESLGNEAPKEKKTKADGNQS